MTTMSMEMTRRRLLSAGAASIAVAALPLHAEEARSIHVVKGVGCECCTAWINYLKADGFVVTEEELYGMLLIRFKLDNNIPQRMISCHTGQIAGYLIEGHVPVADINRLLEERPEAIGISVPNMPYGAPGMGAEDEREAYDVFLIRKDGVTEVFNSYPAA